MSGPRHGAASRRTEERGPGPVGDLATSRVRRRRWRPGELSMRLDLRPTGMVLGPAQDGTTPVFSLLGPTQPTRVGVLGDLGIAKLIALRLLGNDCDLTVVTGRRDEWQSVADAMPHRSVSIVPVVRRWPLEVIPPPWALIVDMPQPPPAGFARVPWSTVVHLSPTVPVGSGWWQSAQLVLTTRGFARPLSAIRPRTDLSLVESMVDADVLAVDQHGARLLRPSLSYDEYRLLTGNASTAPGRDDADDANGT